MDFTGHEPQVVMVPKCGRCGRRLEPVVGGPVDGPAYVHVKTLDDQQAAYVARGKAEREKRAADAPVYQGEPTECHALRYVQLGRMGDWRPCHNKATRVRIDSAANPRPVCGTHARVDHVSWRRESGRQ